MTTNDLLKCMHDYDIIIHPYVLYCNPDIAKELKEHIPETVKLIPLSFLDKDTSYLINRAKLEKECYIPDFSFLGGDMNENRNNNA